MRYPERIVPDDTEPGILALHLKRYELALPACSGRDVLDVACGVGYGSVFLAQEARSVIAVDLSPETIAYARVRYAAPNLDFRVGDASALELPDASIDVVCCFETIEHVDDPARTLAELARVLRFDGTAYLSTPRADRTTDAPENPFHRNEWAPADFERLLGSAFDSVELLAQHRRQTSAHRLAQRLDVLGLRRCFPFLRGAARLLGTAPTAELTSDDIVISREGLDRASELIAVCRAPRR